MSGGIAVRGPVVLAAGGTGGHLFPAEAVARELLARGRSVALVTDRRGAEFGVEGVRTFRIPSGRFGRGLRGKVKGLAGLAAGTVAAWRLLDRLRPAAVVGFGGYPSVPTMMAAAARRLPTVIHEQNAVLGRANRMLAARMRKIAAHFASVEGLNPRDLPRLVETGNPVRPAFAAIRARPYTAPEATGPFRILILGGSQGARILSAVVPAALAALPADLKVRLGVSQQARAEDVAAVEAAYAAAGIAAEIRPFFDDVPARLGAAHLVIARAGGSTAAELTMTGRPAILVPYAAALADEQTANARILEAAGAGWMISEARFTPEHLAGLVNALTAEPARLVAAAAAARALGRPDAAACLAGLVDEVAGAAAA